MLKYTLLIIVTIFVNYSSLMGASHAFPSLQELSGRAIVEHEANLILDELPPSIAHADPLLRDAALRNALRRFGLNLDLQRMRDLVGEKSARLYYTRTSRDQHAYRSMTGQHASYGTPIDAIDPGQTMNDDQRLFMDVLQQKYNLDFNKPVGQRLVMRAVENKNVDFLIYALKYGFDIKKYQSDIEKVVAYYMFKDYSQDILLPFLQAEPQERSSAAFIPVVQKLLQAGAIVKPHHIQAARQAHNQALEDLFTHYYNQQGQGSSLAPILPIHNNEPLGIRKQSASPAPAFNPAALTQEPQAPLQEESDEDEKEEEKQEKKPKKSSIFDIFKRKKK